MKFQVRTVQTFTVTRTIDHEIEADTIDQALLEVEFDGFDAPAFEDKGWQESWSLEGEQQGVVR